jgi:hypothetical protein
MRAALWNPNGLLHNLWLENFLRVTCTVREFFSGALSRLTRLCPESFNTTGQFFMMIVVDPAGEIG